MVPTLGLKLEGFRKKSSGASGCTCSRVLGRRRLRNIRPSTIQGWLKTTEALAERTRALIFGHVVTILNAAVDDELIRKNPCLAKSVRRPKPLPVNVTPLGARDRPRCPRDPA